MMDAIDLPPVGAPTPFFVTSTTHEDVVFTSGALPIADGGPEFVGLVGAEVTIDQGIKAAETAARHLLSTLKEAAAGDLGRIRILKLTVMVASAPGFREQHLVANGASQLLTKMLGDQGRSARTAVGVAGLPLGCPVEVEAIAVLVS